MRFFDNMRSTFQQNQMRRDMQKIAKDRQRYVNSLDFSSNPGTHALVADIKKTNYIDIAFYTDRVYASNKILSLSTYGFSRLEVDELRKLVESVKKQLHNPHYTYRIQNILDTGASWTHDVLIGYTLHNDNYNKYQGIFRYWDEKQRRYRIWDVKNQKFLN